MQHFVVHKCSNFLQDVSIWDVAADVFDSERIKCLQQALDGHVRLHAEMKKEIDFILLTQTNYQLQVIN